MNPRRILGFRKGSVFNVAAWCRNTEGSGFHYSGVVFSPSLTTHKNMQVNGVCVSYDGLVTCPGCIPASPQVHSGKQTQKLTGYEHIFCC